MINRDFEYMKRYENQRDFIVEENSLYLYGYDSEERSHAGEKCLRSKGLKVTLVELEYVDKDEMHICGTNEPNIPLRSNNGIVAFIERYGCSIVYIDVSGMDVRLASALLLWAHKAGKNVHIIYTEPERYITDKFHKNGEYNEWAGNIDGIDPLPGFANFANPEDDFVFCVFLGFEGGRFQHMISNMQPMEDLTVPVIGIPGFRIEYPYNAFWSNSKGFEKTKSYGNVKYASANSIVDAYLLLVKIANEYKGSKIIIAPIGTKPHAMASVAFAMKNPTKVEIAYDNPKKTESRSEGVGVMMDCDITRLIAENQ